MTKPQFSIIIPVKQISYYLIFETLPALNKQDFHSFEVIILPDSHTQYDVTLLKQYPWLRIIPTGAVGPAPKRNLGAKKSRGEILAFIDDDAYPPPNWLGKAAKLFTQTRKQCYCGPGVLPPQANFWEKVFDTALINPFCSGPYTYRFIPEKKRVVDDFPSMNFLIKKAIFLKIKGFNNNYWPGEDSKLCEDITQKLKLQIIYHPDILIYHHRRNSLSGYLKQHANYGFHRGLFFAHGDRNSRSLYYLFPSLLLLYVLLLLIALPISLTFHLFFSWQILTLPILLYLGLIMFGSLLSVFRHHRTQFILPSLFIVILTHFIYGTIFLKGFFSIFLKRKKITVINNLLIAFFCYLIYHS